MKVCRHCGIKYSTGGYKYCEPCRPVMAAQKSADIGREKRAIARVIRFKDRPWGHQAALVCWLERECVACGQQKPRSAYKAGKAKSPDRLESACRECMSRRKSCRYLFATEETKRQTKEAHRRWRRSDSGKAFRAKQRKNPEHEKSYRRKRLERLAQQDDGTVTGAVLRKEFARTRCPYCAAPMQTKDKQLDHMHPLALGGLHSACNVLVCCVSCNGRKAHLSFTDWLWTLEPKQQAACRALWVKRYGAPPEQVPMLLPDPSVTKRKVETLKQRETRQAIAEAKRARAAWFKRDAPDEWMAAWYEASGKPWNNPRISAGEKYRLRYQGDRVFRERQKARIQRYKARHPRITVNGRQVYEHRV